MMINLVTPIAILTSLQSQVQMNGKTISGQVKMVGGQPYIPLSDLAKSMGMQVVKTSSGYKLIAAGGANGVSSKVSGRIGEELFTGDWKFKATALQEVIQYKRRFGDAATIDPARPGEKLVVVTCRLKNGHKVSEQMNFTNSFATNSHSALTDADQHSYPIYDYDVHYTYFKWAAQVLPGAAIDFALVFSVPKDTRPKDLIYSIYRYDDRGVNAKTTDVRVHLGK